VVESTSLVVLLHPATQAKAATPTTLKAIRWIEFISLVLPRTLGCMRDTPGWGAPRCD
jgi:hypothetical protein